MLMAGQIGFGSGNLYGGRHHAHSLALMRAALDAGIRWIDTAPLYGHGAAEAIVGEAIAERREDLVLVSKAGILPSRLTTGYKLHARAAALLGKFPGGKALCPSPQPRRPLFHVFAPADVRSCVENSLTALRTDRLDYLLLHECDPGDALRPDLLATLDSLVAEGKILGFGTATDADKTAEIAASTESDRFALWQVAASGWGSPLRPPGGADQGLVLHSLLGARLKSVLDRLKTDSLLREAAHDLDIDADQPDLARRLVAHALLQTRVRAVLFSTQDMGRLGSMAGAGSISAAAAKAGALLMDRAMANA